MLQILLSPRNGIWIYCSSPWRVEISSQNGPKISDKISCIFIPSQNLISRAEKKFMSRVLLVLNWQIKR